MNQSFPYLELGNVAYLSMDVAIDSHIPTYSGGLGILAGDMLRSAADLGIPMIGVSLLHRKGYFQQRLDRRESNREPLGVVTRKPSETALAACNRIRRRPRGTCMRLAVFISWL